MDAKFARLSKRSTPIGPLKVVVYLSERGDGKCLGKKRKSIDSDPRAAKRSTSNNLIKRRNSEKSTKRSTTHQMKIDVKKAHE